MPQTRWLPLALLLVSACHARTTEASKYETTTLSRGTLTSKVTASGTVSALVTVTVGAQVSGRISKLLVDYNSKVKKGQLLAEIDPTLFKAALDQQEADILVAKAQLTSALATMHLDQQVYDRDVELLKQKLISDQQRDTDKANLEVAKAAVDTGKGNLILQEAQVRTARANLFYTKIISPIDGVVVSRTIDLGQTVVSSFSAPALFTIAEDLQKMQVDTNVAESDIGHIQSGTKAFFTVDAYPGERFNGRIRQIRVAPQTVQNVVTYDVVIDVDNPDLKLLPGMTATAEFVTDRHEDILKVSNAAFRFHPPADMLPPKQPHSHAGAEGRGANHEREAHPTDRKSIWVLRDGKPTMVSVQVGITDGHETEITGPDLAEGDTVITGTNADSTGSSQRIRRMF